MTEGVMGEERGGEKRKVKLGVKRKRSREWGRERGGGVEEQKRRGRRKGYSGEKGRGGAKERVWEWEEEEEKRR